MENLGSLSAVIDSVVHPVLALNTKHQVVAINTQAAELLCVNEVSKGMITFGQLLGCDNAINISECGTSIFCTRCRISQVLDMIFENRGVLKNQTGLISTDENGIHHLWRIHFSAKYLNLANGIVLLTIHHIFKDKEEPINPDQPQEFVKPSLEYSDKPDVVDFGSFPKIIKTNTWLLKIEACLNAWFNNYDNGLLMVDEACRVLKWNKRFLDIFGITDDSIREGLDFTEVISFPFQESDADEGASWQNTIKNCVNPKSLTGYIKNPRGFQVHIHFELIPFFDVESKPQGAIILTRDISETTVNKDKAEVSLFAIEHSPFEFYFIEPSGKIQYANKIARDTIGLGNSNIDGFHIKDIHPNRSDDWWAQYYQQLEDSEIVKFETSHLNSQGISYPVVVNMSLLKQGRNTLVCYFSYDNSEQYRIQETLLKESRVNESLAEISHELSLHNTLGSVTLLVRQYALEITDSMFCFIVYEEPTTNKFVSSIYTDSSDNFQEQVFQIESLIKSSFHENKTEGEGLRLVYSDILFDTNELKDRDDQIARLIPFKNAAWTGIFIHEKYYGLLFVAGKESDYSNVDLVHLNSLANLFGIAVNRIQEQIKLINNMKQLELALDVANMGIWNVYPEENRYTFDSRSDTLLVNAGFSVNNNLKQTDDLIHPDDIGSLLQSFNEHMNSNSSFFRCVIRIRSKRKEYRWYEINGRIVNRSKTGSILQVTGVILDINNIMKLNDELLRSKEEAVFANKAKSAFIARISHEIRTPLNAIIGFSDYLINQVTDAVQLDYLNNIKNSGNRLVELLTDVLDYSKIESGMMEVKEKPVKVADVVDDISKMFEYTAKQKRIEFKVEMPNDLPEFILLDEVHLRQIIVNLVGNAIKFTDKGFVELLIDAKNAGNNKIDIIISVIDTGIGIRQDFQTRIFEDFTQQEDQDNRKYGGTGLGLGIVKKLVDLMSGTISLRSLPGEGSQFTVELPNRTVPPFQMHPKSISSVPSQKIKVSKKTDAKTEPIGSECKLMCINNLKSDWNQFRVRPSFKNFPNIIGKINTIANQFNDNALKLLALRMEKCISTFDVEAVSKIISDFEDYTQINQ